MSSDPWEGLTKPADTIVGRRWPHPHLLDAYWALAPSGAPGLVIRGVDAAALPDPLPRPRGLSLTHRALSEDTSELHLFLEAAFDREVFQRLCEDLLEHSAVARSTSEATMLLMDRLRRWQSLLSMSRGTELPEHEVRGLFGELATLLDLAAPTLGIRTAIESWIAPERAVQDFSLPGSIVEVKTRLANAEAEVSISSLDQLEDAGRPLHLLVVTIDAEPSNGISINDQAARLVELAEAVDLELGDLASEKLRKRGYAMSPRYDGWRYTTREFKAYKVEADFPRITRDSVSPGIVSAVYVLSLTAITSYEISTHTLTHP